MGYDVNYNSADYADAQGICQQVYAQLQEVESSLLRAAVQSDQCQNDVAMQSSAAGLSARSYFAAQLAGCLRRGYQHAAESVIEARRLAERVAAAIENYEYSEALIQKMVLAESWKEIGEDFFTQSMNNANRPPTETMQSLLRMLMVLNPWNIVGTDSNPQELVTETTRELTGMIESAGPQRSIELTRIQEQESIEIDGTLDSYTQLHRLLNDGGENEHSKFIVAQVDPNKYIVIIPGTQDGLGGPNPFDTMGIVDAFGRDSENYVGPISDALEYSGAGPDDEVIVTGYSQGGIHAANLLKNRLMRKKFKMTKAITFGSPIGGIDLPEEVRTLSLEDKKDMVPGTDGRGNKVTERQMTVSFDGPRRQIMDQLPQDGIFGAPHSLTNYEDHVRELQQEPTPEIRQQLSEFTLPTGPLAFRRFTIERRAERKPKGKEKRREDLDHQIAPPH
ncbi:hypothetical protein AUR04nite_03970 [Glutamicibacter uratoxydans]|uniref:Fungal lipase-like domain-containing protein n=1 Tax=Glutamicibacter uratoxydans TaxID=43667 RepID=A0A4Y4DMJ8_GLUUR|nr:hypothetical protein [Glutamicibacter uratoxydans]GED04865.1 hypothetical protein AUR04nite_03970 [Glutamicibacter uratoxydans]